ncbi:drug/metabolite exporter YedA [soil metagenome]
MKAKLIASLLAVYLIWGSTYLAMQICIGDHLPPMLMAGLRYGTAGATLLAIAVWSGAKLPPWRDWLRVLPVGVCFFVGGNGFIAVAEQTISSSGAAVVAATMPLWVGVLGRFTGEVVSRREWITLLLGFLGVVVLMGGPSLAGETSHVVLLLLAPIAWAVGSLLSRKTRDVGGANRALVGPALQMMTGGAALAVLGVLRRESWPAHAPTEAYLCLLYLWSFGSLIGFTAYGWLLANARPVTATSYAFVNPIIAVLLGAAFHHEPLGWTTVVANVLIVTAVMLVLWRPRSGVPASD